MNKKTHTKTKEQKITYEELENLLKKALADYQNLEKNIDKRILIKDFQTKKSLVEKFLPILDGVYMSEKSAEKLDIPDEIKAWFDGVENIVDEIEDILEDIGVEEIETEKGDDFDPNVHEAITTVKEGEDGKIFDIIQPGFAMNGEVIRPTKVVVSKNS
jgi:molecular chaperone GrpE